MLEFKKKAQFKSTRPVEFGMGFFKRFIKRAIEGWLVALQIER